MGIAKGKALRDRPRVDGRFGQGYPKGSGVRSSLRRQIVPFDPPGDSRNSRPSGLSRHGVQRARLRAEQRGLQDPVAHTGSLCSLEFRRLGRKTEGKLGKMRLQRVGTVGHNQHVPRAGHGHIENPQFLGDIFRAGLAADGRLCDGAEPCVGCLVIDRAARPEAAVKLDRVFQILKIKPTG